MLKGEFNKDSKIEFSEVRSKTRNLTQLQAGMFIDRADLWESKPRQHRKPVSPAQQNFFEKEAKTP